MSAEKKDETNQVVEATEETWADGADLAASKNPLLERIMGILLATKPEAWRVGGADLTQELRVSQPRNSYDQILARDIEQGSLVLHFSQPVMSQYLPGGYQLIASAPARYSIEVRDKIFDADKAVDPKYAALQKTKRCDVLASGDIAKTLFLQVRDVVRKHTSGRQHSFDQIARGIVETLLKRIDQMPYAEWERTKESVGELDRIDYITRIDGVKLTLSRKTTDFQHHFVLELRDDKLVQENTNQALLGAAFARLEELDQNEQLRQLNSKLEELGLVDKK